MPDSVYTVSQINTYIKNMFTQDYLLHAVSVKGEVSNCKYHSSGHIYFTLKDRSGVMSCVMFAGNRRGLSFSLTEGMQVICDGKVDVYERDGRYQLYCNRIRRDGLGELYERFLKLKEELEERGLFAEEYKKPLPSSPRVIGVVTAPTGAAVRDIISVAKGRDPYVQILLFPAIVQGQSAVPSIVRGIKLLDKAGVDVIIVGRGGGSLEDLWAFNEEEVAQAIFDCDTPVISAVGHETDTTIADFVADVRAETPTAAAVLATIDRIAYDNYLEGSKKTLDRAIGYAIEREKNSIRARADKLNLLSPQSRINTYRHRSALATDRLQNAMDKALAENKKRMSVAAERLNGVSPLLKLSQGYSYTEDSEGRRVSSVDRVKSGERIKVYVRDGQIDATVDAVSRQADS
ncbi:MAG: exodeoxyribonuclease VII large subunit [Lachnospiraceae bacterium]|nr:exodeoxyribonuclease VII large subunit [Lachnospiraceae bacterium]